MRSSLLEDPPHPSRSRPSLWGPPRLGWRPLEFLLPWRLPLASLALVAVHGVMFLLEMSWGGSLSALTHQRMGASVVAPWPEGEPWRWLSAGFLHQGWRHFVLNAVSLLVCGVYVEGVLGPSRLLLLYVLSLLGTQLCALRCGSPMPVLGDSGGILGLAGALAVLMCQPRLAIARRNRVAPLVGALLVVGATFVFARAWDVGVAQGTSLVGAAVGGGLALSGVLTWRGPFYVWHAAASWLILERKAVRWSAGVAAVLTGQCLLVALLAGRPWELGGTRALVRVTLPGTPVSVRVPARTTPRVPEGREPEEGEFSAMTYGEAFWDPLAVTVTARRLEKPVAEAQLVDETFAWSEELLRQAQKPLPPGYAIQELPSLDSPDGRVAVHSSRRVGIGFVVTRWSMFREGWRIELEVAHDLELSGEGREQLDDVVRSVQVLEGHAPAP